MRKNQKINTIDILILLTFLFSISGFLLVKAEKSPLNKVIKGKEEVAIVVSIPDIYISKTKLFKVGDKTAITVRNRPYTNLEIIGLKKEKKKKLLQNLNGSYKLIDDPTKTDIYDLNVILKDLALITSNGYVIEGNKIKIGNPVELEGFNYRLNGKIIDILPFASFAKKQ